MVLAHPRGYRRGMADIFDVIADGTRRDLLQVLLGSSASGGELSVGQLVERLGLSQPTVSKHLKVLRDHGLVAVREDGQHRYYRLDASALEEVEEWLVPFLGAGSPAEADPAGAAVFAAWSGAEAGENLGRRIAEGRNALETLPKTVRRRIFRR